MLYVVVVRPVSCLERTYNTYGACLAEISGYKFSILSPCRAAYKVRRALLTVLCAESAIDGNGKGSYRYTGRSRFKLGIGSKSAADNNFIEVEVSHIYFPFPQVKSKDQLKPSSRRDGSRWNA